MRIPVTAVDAASARAYHVVAEVEPETTVGAFAALLLSAGPAGAASTTGLEVGFVPALYVGDRRLDPAAPLRETGIRAGSVIGIDGPAGPVDPDPIWMGAADPAFPVEIRAVSGPDAGRVWPLGVGVHDIGGTPGSSVVIEGMPAGEPGVRVMVTAAGQAWLALPPEAAGGAAISWSARAGGARANDAVPAGASGALGALDGLEWSGSVQPPVDPVAASHSGRDHDATVRLAVIEPPEGQVMTRGEPDQIPWPAGGDLAMGGVLLQMARRSEADAAVTLSEDGLGVDYNRPPRIVPPIQVAKFRMPRPPNVPGRRPIPIAIMLAPAVLGVGMVFILHSYLYLAFAIFSPVLAVTNWVSGRRNGRRTFWSDLHRYWERRLSVSAAVRQAAGQERAVRTETVMDPARVALTAVGPGRRLWERRRGDADHLVLRLGTTNQPSLVAVEQPTRDEQRTVHWNLPDVPLGIDLAAHGVVGVTGESGITRAVARWLTVQAAVLQSPRDVRIYLLAEQSAQDSWEWVRWLPHARPAGANGPAVLVGNDPETIANRVGELLSLIRSRDHARGATVSSVVFSEPDIIVILDGARRLRDVAGVIQILTDGPRLRVFSVCLDERERLLPEECKAVVRCDPAGLTVRQSGQPEISGVRPDLVGPAWSERVARALAPLRDVTSDDEGTLPTMVSLLELLGQEPPDVERVVSGWAKRPASTTVLLGSGFDGPVAFDLVRDGPHGLIAGTTGSGKSELLQSLVASAALANRPDELVFVLIDYKGGSAFRDCVRLPHVLGMVTDLDNHLVERALASLAAELLRREKVLAEAGAKDHLAYRTLRARDPALPALPRLLLVIDEFATLIRAVPDFIPGLVSIAQRGRSLGVHLILATQRPGGVVSADIRANTNLRIALRVTDPLESQDVIDSGDAAGISAAVPGRAMARLAHKTVLPFQTAFAGIERPGDDGGTAADGGEAPGAAERPAWAASVPWSRLGRRLEPPEGADSAEGADDVVTDLTVLVDTIRAAADRISYEPQPSPWLPPLPHRVLLDELAALTPAAASVTGELRPVAYGLTDLPALQARVPLTIDLSVFGHLYVLGAARSGRSQVLRVIAAALANAHSVADVHFYGIDAAGGALMVLQELPHAGTIAPRTDLDRVDRLIGRLGAELTRRQGLLTRHSCANLTELRARLPGGERPAHILLFIDGWEGLSEMIGDYDGGRLVDDILRLVREGAASGVHVVATSERALLSGRMGSLNDNRLLLRMGERSDYTLIGMRMADIPDTVPPGRGWYSNRQSESQVALITRGTSGQEQAEGLRMIGASAAARDSAVPRERRPFEVATLPSAVTFADAYARVPAALRRPLWALLGVGGDDLEPVGVDFAGASPAFLVAGPPGSGRSNTLSTFAASLLAAGTKILAITPRNSPLGQLSRHPDALVIAGTALRGPELGEALAKLGGPCVVLIDDCDMLLATPADPVLREIVATGRDRGIGLACAGSPEVFTQTSLGWLGELRRHRAGVLLGPRSVLEGDLIGMRLPSSVIRRAPQPGRAYVANRAAGGVMAVLIPRTILELRLLKVRRPPLAWAFAPRLAAVSGF